ncbi:MAG: hypothetical protein JST54_20025 [Deltaproteobacteria bacterium]|nr:hypothetical protein [Deltaproteobacteria bacterium]
MVEPSSPSSGAPTAGAWRVWALTALAFALLALAFMAPLLHHLDNWCIEDWDQHAFYHEAPRVSVLQYHQLPLWNPWYCGGTDLLANPQNRALSPTFVIDLLLGAIAGLKIEYWLHAVLGMLGLYALARRLGVSALGAWLPACATFLSSLYALPVSAGMSWVTSLAFMPWAVLAFLHAYEKPLFCLLTGAALALMNFNGGAYTSVILCTFLGCYALAQIPRVGFKRSAMLLVGAVGSSVLLGAVKLFPAAAFMHEHPRKIDLLSGLSVESLLVGLFSLDQRLQVAYTHFDGLHFDPVVDGPTFSLWHGIATEFDDVGMYIGVVGLLLLVIGLATSARKRRGLALTMLGFLWLSLGDRMKLSPLKLLHLLPVFESMRYAERYRFIWFPCAMIFAALGLDWIRARLDGRFAFKRLGTAVAILLLGLELADFHRVVTPVYAAACPITPFALPTAKSFHQELSPPSYGPNGPIAPDAKGFEVIYGSFSSHLPTLLSNVGAVDCYETAWVPRQAVPASNPGYRGEVWLAGQGSVDTLEWSPNRLRYAVHAQQPGKLVVNQNFYSSWRASDGRPVRNENGQLAVDVTPSDTTIELEYVPRSFQLGLVVSAISWIALAGLGLSRLRRAKVQPAP